MTRRPPLRLTGGETLGADGAFSGADVHVADGRIVDTPAAGAITVDCAGLTILPGAVDAHGDAFEQALHPRPGVDMPFDAAMNAVDRQLVANGITTAHHGLSVSWEPGARSPGAARRFMDGLAAARGRFLADHRVQLRWEVFAHDAIDDIMRWLDDEPTPAIAFNDHATETLAAMRAGGEPALRRWADKAGVSLERYLAEAEATADREAEVPGRVRDVAARARAAGATMLAHDEADAAARAANRALGMDVSEFPLTPEAAADAIAHGEHVVMGAPNALRGASHKGALSAEDAVRGGLCTILASDYYYPSLICAVERLAARGVVTLAEGWRLIAANPAAAMGLTDRGAIAAGRRADIAVIDRAGPWRVVHVVAGGALVSFGR